jgi:cytidylate kinase
MTYRALTISREYGSGGAEIAGIVATRLGWRLVDRDLITEISARAKVPPSDAAALDEQNDPWLHRISRPLWGKGGDGFSAITTVELFDADAEAALVKLVIEEAYCVGKCVFVGRGSQCILQAKTDVFRALIYAPWEERVRRVQARVAPDTDVNKVMEAMDEQRLEYVRRHYGEDASDPHLYDLMINCRKHPEACAALIVFAMETGL